MRIATVGSTAKSAESGELMWGGACAVPAGQDSVEDGLDNLRVEPSQHGGDIGEGCVSSSRAAACGRQEERRKDSFIYHGDCALLCGG